MNTSRAAWEQIIMISGEENVDHLRPTITVDNEIPYVVWDDSSDGDSDIYLSNLTNDTWQPKMKLNHDYGVMLPDQNESKELQFDAHIVVENGKIYALWIGNRDGDADIYYRYFDGVFWHPEVKLNEDNYIEWQSNPRIAVDRGKVHAVWVNPENPWQDTGDVDIHYRYFDGISWYPEEIIGNDTGDDPQNWPAIAAVNDRVHIVWADMGDGDADIFYIQSDGGSWQLEQEISIDTLLNETQLDPAIAVEDDYVHVVWADRKDSDYDIFYRYYNGASWHPEMEISQDTLQELQQRPMIAVEDDHVFVTWEDYHDGDSDIYFRYYDGSSWSSAEEISSDVVDEYQIRPHITVNNKIVHIVWMQEHNQTFGIYYRTGIPKTTVLPSQFQYIDVLVYL